MLTSRKPSVSPDFDPAGAEAMIGLHANVILAEAVSERPLAERVGHLRGQLAREPEDSDSWRKQIREKDFRR